MLPSVASYPMALRRSAATRWAGMGDMTLSYAEHNHAPYGRLTQCVGMIAVAASQYAHAILAARGQWITNEKRLLRSAGLDALDTTTAGVTEEPSSMIDAVKRARDLVQQRIAAP
jgi:hypothetical protein